MHAQPLSSLQPAMSFTVRRGTVSYTHLDVYKRQFVFLANYVLLFAIIFLSMLLNSVNAENKDFIPFMRENVTSVIYLLFCIFILFVIIYFYFFFEDRPSLKTAKNIWLVFILLDVRIIV